MKLSTQSIHAPSIAQGFLWGSLLVTYTKLANIKPPFASLMRNLPFDLRVLPNSPTSGHWSGFCCLVIFIKYYKFFIFSPLQNMRAQMASVSPFCREAVCICASSLWGKGQSYLWQEVTPCLQCVLTRTRASDHRKHLSCLWMVLLRGGSRETSSSFPCPSSFAEAK